jgi:hypothetical protein
MDRKRFLDLLKNLQNIMRCPACGALYSVEEMQFMGNQDGYFLLSLTCTKCNLPVWVNFFAGNPEVRIISDLTITDMELSQKQPITVNEVIDFHSFIKGFSGDFKRYLKTKK